MSKVEISKEVWERLNTQIKTVLERTQYLEARVEELEAEKLKPSERCEDCDDYYATSVLRLTRDDVKLCPRCWEGLSLLIAQCELEKEKK